MCSELLGTIAEARLKIIEENRFFFVAVCVLWHTMT